MIILETIFCKILTQNVLNIPLNYFFRTFSGHKSINDGFQNLAVLVSIHFAGRLMLKGSEYFDRYSLLWCGLSASLFMPSMKHWSEDEEWWPALRYRSLWYSTELLEPNASSNSSNDTPLAKTGWISKSLLKTHCALLFQSHSFHRNSTMNSVHYSD